MGASSSSSGSVWAGAAAGSAGFSGTGSGPWAAGWRGGWGGVVVRAGGQGDSRDAGLVAGIGQLVVEKGDAAALREGKGSIVSGAEHQEVFLHLREGTAVGRAVFCVGLRQAQEEIGDPHGIVGVGPVVAHGLFKLFGGEFDLAVGVKLVDADHVAALLAAGGPEAEGAGTEIGVDLLGGNVQLSGDALAEVSDGVRVVAVEIFTHRGASILCGR